MVKLVPFERYQEIGRVQARAGICLQRCNFINNNFRKRQRSPFAQAWIGY
jgi:hypothetical protein